MRRFMVMVVVVAMCAVLAGCIKNPFRESVFFTERLWEAGSAG